MYLRGAIGFEKMCARCSIPAKMSTPEKPTICSQMRLVSLMRWISVAFISISRATSSWLSASRLAARPSAASLSASLDCRGRHEGVNSTFASNSLCHA